MRIFLLIVMLLAQPVFAGQSASQDLSRFFDPPQKAIERDQAIKDLLPDLSKAPKWRDIAATPEFQALSPVKQAEAKANYFDYWIAPHVLADGLNVADVRIEFIRQIDEEVLGKQRHGQKLLSDEDVFGSGQKPKESTWGRIGWPHYVVLGVAVLGIAMLIRTLRTRKPSPAIQTKAVFVAGGSKVNDRQRTILVVAGVLIGLMLLYPPFQHHTGAGMGYSWLFSPPEYGYSVHAVINVGQLLIQWVAVLLIGSIAFVLSGQAGMVAPATPPAVSTHASASVASQPETAPDTPAPAQLYEAVVGGKSSAYYLSKFATFDQMPSGLRPGWNWAAFLVGGVWALYRKMYGWFFAFWGIEFVTQIAFTAFLKLGSPVMGAIVFFLPWLAFSTYANSLYHRNVKKRIAVAQFALKDESKLIEHLAHKGGVHVWVIWVFGLIPLIGIVAAVVIPMLARQ